MKGQRWAAAAAASVAIGLAGCSSADDPAESHDGHGQAAVPAADARRLTVEAGAMTFTPAPLRITAGEEVAISLTAADVTHDLVVDEVDFHLAADPGEVVEGALRIDEPGTYTAYCSVPGHRNAGMETTVMVTP